MNAVVSMSASPARSVVEERAMRPPTIGRVRPGIKVLKQSIARDNERASKIYREMVEAGDSFETIAKALESQCRIRDALVPKNVPYFTCRRSDFTNPVAAWATTGRKFFSEYGNDGTRYCKTYAKVERDPRAQRGKRHFGGRVVIFRQDDSIPDGICDPEQCPQYQSRQCNLSAGFIFAVPDIKGLGLIELPTGGSSPRTLARSRRGKRIHCRG